MWFRNEGLGLRVCESTQSWARMRAVHKPRLSFGHVDHIKRVGDGGFVESVRQERELVLRREPDLVKAPAANGGTSRAN